MQGLLVYAQYASAIVQSTCSSNFQAHYHYSCECVVMEAQLSTILTIASAIIMIVKSTISQHYIVHFHFYARFHDICMHASDCLCPAICLSLNVFTCCMLACTVFVQEKADVVLQVLSIYYV